MRTLVASIKDNNRAELIVREIAERQNLMGEDAEPTLTDLELVEEIVTHVQMDAMIARPVLACECGGSKGAGKRTAGYGQTKRFLWWVHAPCRRPTRYIVDRWVSNMLNGCRDLLTEIVPSHVEVTDHLTRDSRARVARQDLRNARRYDTDVPA